MISNILKPKSIIEIKRAVLDNIKTYNLKTFFSLIDTVRAKELQSICNRLHIDPKEMEICKPKEITQKILSWPFINKINISIGDVHEYERDEIYYAYSTRYFVIRYAYYGFDHDFLVPYYAFPKHVLPLLFEFAFNDKLILTDF